MQLVYLSYKSVSYLNKLSFPGNIQCPSCFVLHHMLIDKYCWLLPWAARTCEEGKVITCWLSAALLLTGRSGALLCHCSVALRITIRHIFCELCGLVFPCSSHCLFIITMFYSEIWFETRLYDICCRAEDPTIVNIYANAVKPSTPLQIRQCPAAVARLLQAPTSHKLLPVPWLYTCAGCRPLAWQHPLN